jgi:hypothetical protein
MKLPEHLRPKDPLELELLTDYVISEQMVCCLEPETPLWKWHKARLDNLEGKNEIRNNDPRKG